VFNALGQIEWLAVFLIAPVNLIFMTLVMPIVNLAKDSAKDV
jgi:hypothetical protein